VTAPPVGENRSLALTIARNFLPPVRIATLDDIRAAVGAAKAGMEAMGLPFGFDETELARELESQVNVFVGDSTSLDDTSDHIEWLSARRHEIDWRFWERYVRWLGDVRHLPPQALLSMDKITDDVLRRLEDPQREGAWDRRGMVVGQVQSGKTGNYAGLICKAADAGYKLIVVLAGLHNSLRSQTQLRLDEAFLGFDTQQGRMYDRTNRRIGVGAMPGSGVLPANSMTNSEEKGDFSLRIARQVGIRIGSDPVLLVVKKNKAILRNLIEWVTSLHQELHPESGRLVVPNIPMLVIDDEADNASVNTKDRKQDVPRDEDGRPDDEIDPSVINGLVRELLHSFEKSAYVGYTATPFANIFIYEGEMSERYGEDLFPRSFIVRLPEPSNYTGPSQVFGVRADPLAGLQEKPGLPIVRVVNDSDPWIAPKHKKTDAPGSRLPASLHEAIRAFILTCAARRARGQVNVHNSMLVHVTRFTDVQEVVERQITAEVGRLRDRLRYGDGDSAPTLRDELRTLWERDFLPTTHAFDDDQSALSFDEVAQHLEPAAGRIETLRINGTVRDALGYYDHPDGYTVIAVGGDKLSRGLTLEGLSVSYYLRASRMYDTLMQMGRWFGYRPGYGDLCRLYTTRELVDWYRDITVANEELLALFDEMAAVGGTPRDFGLRVRRHPDGLLITAPAKMRNGKTLRLSFQDTTIETISFDRDAATQSANLELVRGFIRRHTRSDVRPEKGNHVLRGVDGSLVASLLSEFRTHSGARKARGELLHNYVIARAADGRLVNWTVALCGPRSPENGTVNIGGLEVGLTLRNLKVFRTDSGKISSTPPADSYVIRRLVSPIDEALDLSPSEKDAAKRYAQQVSGDEPFKGDLPGPAIRKARPEERGLLLLYALAPKGADRDADPASVMLDGLVEAVVGFAVSFPADPDAPGVEYAVNNPYWQMELGFE
jgi:hypothetical protein